MFEVVKLYNRQRTMNLKCFYILVVMLLTQSIASANLNGWSGRTSSPFLSNWSFGIHGGFTSYYGDLSLHDGHYFNKLIYESKPAFGIAVTKHLTPVFGIATQIFYGGFKSDNSSQHSFSTDIFEYNLQVRVDAVELFSPGNIARFRVQGFAGVGQFFYRATQFNNHEGEISEIVHNTGVPEFVLFFGGGLSYQITSRISISSEIAIRQAQNDKLDNFVKSENFDYYSFLSFGITYFIPGTTKIGSVNNLLRNDFSHRWREM
jgi:hypothetical protein